MKHILITAGLLLLFLAAAMAASAQVTVGTTASAYYYQKAWFVGNETTASVPFLYLGTAKNNILSLGGRNDVAANAFDAYTGLVSFQPDLTKYFGNQVALSLDVGGGAATLAAGGTKPAVQGTLNFTVMLTPNTSAIGGYAGGGLIGGNKFGKFSAGIAHYFGGPATVQSQAKKNFVKRYLSTHFKKQTGQ